MVIILLIGLPWACFKCFPQFTDCFVEIWVRVLLLSPNWLYARDPPASTSECWENRCVPLHCSLSFSSLLSFPVPNRVPFLAPLNTFFWEGILSHLASKLGLGKCWSSCSSAMCAKGREWKLGVCGSVHFPANDTANLIIYHFATKALLKMHLVGQQRKCTKAAQAWAWLLNLLQPPQALQFWSYSETGPYDYKLS